jgi:hypothetical protein
VQESIDTGDACRSGFGHEIGMTFSLNSIDVRQHVGTRRGESALEAVPSDKEECGKRRVETLH